MTHEQLQMISDKHDTVNRCQKLLNQFFEVGEPVFTEFPTGVIAFIKQHRAHQPSRSSMSLDMQFASMCEHHFLPFMGTVHILVRRPKYWLGLSNYRKLLDMITHVPTTQEMIVQRLVTVLKVHLEADSVRIETTCHHSCSSLKGSFEEVTIIKDTKEDE